MKDPKLSNDAAPPVEKVIISRNRFLQSAGILAASGVLLNVAGCRQRPGSGEESTNTVAKSVADTSVADKPLIKPVRVSADPTKLPPPIRRSKPVTHHITLETEEVIGEVKPGVLFRYMTFNGQVPAPMIRVRQGDTIDLTVKGDSKNQHPHNVDFHSCYGSGGGAAYTTVGPGQTKRISFKVMDPGAFIYHCAVTDLDFHISSGMFGLILVEPKADCLRLIVNFISAKMKFM